jgi:hypothetical protein
MNALREEVATVLPETIGGRHFWSLLTERFLR